MDVVDAFDFCRKRRKRTESAMWQKSRFRREKREDMGTKIKKTAEGTAYTVSDEYSEAGKTERIAQSGWNSTGVC